MATNRIQSGNLLVKQVTGVPIQPANQQPTNYMFAANLQAQESNALSRILDDMSNSLGKFAAEKRSEEGTEFVAEKPITAYQVELAKNGVVTGLGGGIGKASGDLPSFFNAAVKKARGIEITAHVMAEYSNLASQIYAKLEDNQMTTQEAQQKLNAAQTGLSSVILKIDPAASLQFNAQAAMHGNTVLARGYALEVKRDKEVRQIKFDDLIQNEFRQIEFIFSKGYNINDPEQASSEKEVDALRKIITDQSIVFGDKQTQAALRVQLDKVTAEARVNAVTKYITQNKELMSNIETTLALINSGNLGKMSGTMRWMNDNDLTSAAKVTTNFMAAVSQQVYAAELKAKKIRQDSDKSFAIAYPEYLKALPNSDTQKELKNNIIDIFRKGDGAVSVNIIDKLFDTVERKTKPEVWAQIYDKINKNEIINISQISSYLNNLSNGDFQELVKHLTSNDRRESNDLITGLRLKAKFVDGVTFDKESEQFKNFNDLMIQSEEIKKQLTIENKGRVPTSREILAVIDGRMLLKINKDEIASANTTVNSLLKFLEPKILPVDVTQISDVEGYITSLKVKYNYATANQQIRNAIETIAKRLQELKK